jgi:hypothetical protein
MASQALCTHLLYFPKQSLGMQQLRLPWTSLGNVSVLLLALQALESQAVSCMLILAGVRLLLV